MTGPRPMPGALPEILAPGGDPDAVRAAILARADAVYVGLGRFNARMRATNVALPELRALCRLAHDRGVRVYLTLNVIVTERELEEAIRLGDQALEAGVDALIVQDLGLLSWFHERRPDVGLHASTQLTTHNAAQLEVLARLGVRQVNLSRELALAEIRRLAARAHALGLRVEVFVHGAYCVSFSGQCYLSSLVTGHSGNRGACVQPCRRAFASAPGGAPRFPLNLKDLNALRAAPALIDAGVDALKIEGRRKGFYYVYTVVSAWRARLDAIARGARADDDDPALGTVFNRGFSVGYLEGRVGPAMFAADGTDRSLERLGAVASYTADTRLLRCVGAAALRPGLRAGVFTRDGQYVARFVVEEQRGADRFRIRLEHELKGKLRRGQAICALAEQAEADAVLARLRALAPRRAPLAVRVAGRRGEPLRAVFAADGCAVTVASTVALRPATGTALGREQLTRHLGKLGATRFALESLDATELEPGLALPVSELNRVRQAATRQLEGRAAPRAAGGPAAAPPPGARATPRPPARGPDAPPGRLAQRVLFVTDRLEDARALHAVSGAGTFVALELQEPGDALAGDGLEEWLAPLFPAIVFDALLPAFAAVLEQRRWRLVVSENAGLGACAAAAGVPWIAGALLNTGNSRSLATLGALGARAVVLSPELGYEQVRDLAAAAGAGPVPLVTVFGPLLCLQTRQCLVRDLASCPKDRTDAACLAECHAAGRLDLEPDGRLFAVKRPGFHSQLWDARLVFHPDAITALGAAVGYVVDLRDPGFLARTPADTLAIARFFAEAVRCGRPDARLAARLRSRLGPCWKGPLGRRGAFG